MAKGLNKWAALAPKQGASFVEPTCCFQPEVVQKGPPLDMLLRKWVEFLSAFSLHLLCCTKRLFMFFLDKRFVVVTGFFRCGGCLTCKRERSWFCVCVSTHVTEAFSTYAELPPIQFLASFSAAREKRSCEDLV